MLEDQVKTNNKPQSRGWEFLALIFSFVGAIISAGGALAVFSSQTQDGFGSPWPLPGFVLLEWAIFGIAGFVTAYLSFRKLWANWLVVNWYITGMFIPLIVLGAFSIGVLVLIGFLFFMATAIIFSISKKANFLESFGLLMLGGVINLGVLYLVITLANRAS